MGKRVLMKHILSLLYVFLAVTAFTQVMPKGPISFNSEWTLEGITYIPLNVDKAGSNIWGSVAINPDGVVMIGVANHVDNVAIYTWDTKKNELMFEGDLMEMLHMSMKHWQSKIHTYIYWSPKHKKFFFGTDAGTYRSETILEHPFGYIGGFWCWFDPASHKMGTFGLNGLHRSVKGCVYSEVSGLMMGNTDPQQHFITCDVATGELNDYGRINGFHQPRVLFCDTWGNGYTIDTYGELVKFDVRKKELVDIHVSLPRADKVAFYLAASGIMALQYMPDGTIYGLAHYGIAFKYTPAKNGSGTMEDLGPTLGDDSANGNWRHCYSPNLAVIDNKMYYGIGGHGNFIDSVKKNVFLVEKDIKTKRTRVICGLKKITELTGSGIIDAQGNIYFGGHRKSISAEDNEAENAKAVQGEESESMAYLVKFNTKQLVGTHAK